MIETKNIEEAIMWYKRVLGFRTEGGEGVKYIFNIIDSKKPDEGYAFIVRLNGEIYNCDELVCNERDTKGWTDILFLGYSGALPTMSSVIQDSASITISSPPPISVDSRNETPMRNNVPYFSKKARLKSHWGQKTIPGQVATPSPLTISNLYQSPRFSG